MAFVPSVVSTQEDMNDRLLRTSFQNGTSHSIPTLPVSQSSCARTDGGVYFGQKAALTTSGRRAISKASGAGEKKTQWTAPSSVSAFSDLTHGSHGLSSLRSIATSSRSCDQDVETDLARVHPNSATNEFDRFNKYFSIPSKSSNSVIRKASSFLSSSTEDGVVNDQSPLGKSFESIFGQRDKSLSSNDRHSVKSSLTPAFGKHVSRNPYDAPEKVPTSTPVTLSRTPPYAHTTNSSQLPSLSYVDLVDTEVKFSDLNQKKTYYGIVENVSRKRIATVLKCSGDRVEVHCSQLKLVSPSVKDKVKVVRSAMGSSKITGKIGTLLSITLTGDSGVVQFFAGSGSACRNLVEVKLSHLAKYVTPTKSISEKPLTPSTVSSSSIWGSVVLNNGATFPFAPYPAQATSTSFPTILPVVPPSNLSLYSPASLSSPMSTPSNGNGVTSSAFTPLSLTTNGALKFPASTALPFSFHLPPATSTNSFHQLISRGGTSRDEDNTKKRHSSSSHQSVASIIDRLLSNQRRYHANKDDDSNVDVKASCVRVSLVCPISQKRLKYPSRGNYCKHLQCFDAEAYILMNLHHKPKARVKQSNGRSFVQPLPDKKWYCPICLKHVLESQLYIDRSLMKVVSDVEDSVMEVELSEGGTWRPYKKVVVDVIDLTADDD